MEGHSIISAELLGSYAADAAREVDGVRGLSESQLHRHRAVRVVETDGSVSVELHLVVDRDADVVVLGREVQERVRAYLAQMADVTPGSVDVVVESFEPASAA